MVRLVFEFPTPNGEIRHRMSTNPEHGVPEMRNKLTEVFWSIHTDNSWVGHTFYHHGKLHDVSIIYRTKRECLAARRLFTQTKMPLTCSNYEIEEKRQDLTSQAAEAAYAAFGVR